ncbi:MAG TPA: hypothetical protein VNZ57_00140 [Longimicrobiales bacterium]|nr:hypothetical protein [Longimicrobiales bacterium]
MFHVKHGQGQSRHSDEPGHRDPDLCPSEDGDRQAFSPAWPLPLRQLDSLNEARLSRAYYRSHERSATGAYRKATGAGNGARRC